MSSLPTWEYPEDGSIPEIEIPELTIPNEEEEDLGPSNSTTYLPAECQAAIDQTNAKYNELKEVWDNYISNLRNGDNLNQLQHSMNHIQNKIKTLV